MSPEVRNFFFVMSRCILTERQHVVFVYIYKSILDQQGVTCLSLAISQITYNQNQFFWMSFHDDSILPFFLTLSSVFLWVNDKMAMATFLTVLHLTVFTGNVQIKD
jgi:hypothetical protein